MDSAAALAGQLLIVTGDPVDSQRLAVRLTRLAADLAAMVPSLAAVTVVVHRHGLAIPASVLADDGPPAAVLASLAVPLSAAEHPDLLIAHARAAGAFLLLADDLRHSLRGTDGARVELDLHLRYPPPPASDPLGVALSDLRAIDQSIGVLLAQGFTPTSAQKELQRRSTATVSMPAAARMVLESAQRPGGQVKQRRP